MQSKHQPGSIEALAEIIASRVKGAKPIAPKLRVITSPPRTLFDSITRECCLTRIRRLAKAFDLNWLVEQATFDRACLDVLPDEEIIDLLSRMEKARECREEGVSFEDAGLLKDLRPGLSTFGSK